MSSSKRSKIMVIDLASSSSSSSEEEENSYLPTPVTAASASSSLRGNSSRSKLKRRFQTSKTVHKEVSSPNLKTSNAVKLERIEESHTKDPRVDLRLNSENCDDLKRENEMNVQPNSEINSPHCVQVGQDLSNIHKQCTKPLERTAVESPNSDKSCVNVPHKETAFDEFNAFIKTRLKLTSDGILGITKKLEIHYDAADPTYVSSKEFNSLLSIAVENIKTGAQPTYLYVEDVINSLNANRVKVNRVAGGKKMETSVSELPFSESVSCPGTSNSPVSVRRERSVSAEPELGKKEKKSVRRLEKLLKKIHHKIKKLQCREISLDDLDDSDSSYVREDRLKKRFIKVYNLLCKLKKCSSSADRKLYKKYRFNGTKYEDLNRRVEKLINRKNLFPSFSDIFDLVKAFADAEKLRMPPNNIHRLAEQVFTDVGKELKERRQKDDRDIFVSYFEEYPESVDPAEEDGELKKALDCSAESGANEIQKVIDYYARQQSIEKEDPSVVSHTESSSDEEEEGNSCASIQDSFADGLHADLAGVNNQTLNGGQSCSSKRMLSDSAQSSSYDSDSKSDCITVSD